MRLAWHILVDAVRLWRRQGIEMSAWLLAGLLGQWLLLRAAFEVATSGVSVDLGTTTGQSLLSTCLFALSVTVLLTGVIGMLFVARRELPFVRVLRRRGGSSGTYDESERFIDALAGSLLPFLVFYGAWGLFLDDWRDLQLQVTLDGGRPAQMAEPAPFLVAALTAFVVRLVLERRWRANASIALGLLAAIFEGLWMVLALIGITDYVQHAIRWIADRRIVEAFDDRWDALLGWVVPDAALLLAGLAPWASAAVVVPMLWLILGITVLSRYEPAELHVRRRRSLARRALHVTIKELREKYIPMLYAVRQVLRGGVVVFVAFAIAYACTTLVADGIDRLVRAIVGPRDPAVWNAIADLQSLLTMLVSEPLRIAVIAVAVDELLRRSAAGRGRRSAPITAS